MRLTQHIGGVRPAYPWQTVARLALRTEILPIWSTFGSPSINRSTTLRAINRGSEPYPILDNVTGLSHCALVIG
ncbi:MAG: hypothetical protein JWP89_3563 [Schlesneria sp.]|nr:hypothetical protein [Schlesneria sp.]